VLSICGTPSRRLGKHSWWIHLFKLFYNSACLVFHLHTTGQSF
jgi:hypothetical protein